MGIDHVCVWYLSCVMPVASARVFEIQFRLSTMAEVRSSISYEIITQPLYKIDPHKVDQRQILPNPTQPYYSDCNIGFGLVFEV